MDPILPEKISTSLAQLNLVLETSHSIPEIPQLLNETILLGGKRLRPALCFMMGELLGVSSQRMVPFARAAEFTHSASLAHDDVLDNARTRRNHPTLNAKTSNARAVLAGDLLLARVMVELSEQGRVEIIHDLALVVEDLVNGEWLQLHARGRTDVTREHLLEVARRKTASLMSWCCRVAAQQSENCEPRLLNAATEFGKNLGIAFQMIDDVIDFEATSEKDYAKDYREGLVNFVVATLLQLYPQNSNSIAGNLGSDQNFPWSIAELEEAKRAVRDLATFYLGEANRNLEIVTEYKADTPESESCLESLNHLLLFLGARVL